MEELIKIIKEEAELLERWAKESEQGGWSTHQVKPMRKRSQYLYAIIGKLS